MAKKEVHDSLVRFRVLYNGIILCAMMIFFIFDNDLKKSILDLDFLYFVPFFGLLGISYYFFYVSGKDPGYADETSSKNEPKEIEMEASQVANSSDMSLEVFENTAQANRASLLNKTNSASGNSFYDDDESESDEEKPNETRNKAKFRNSRKDTNPLIPDQRFCEICNLLQPYRTRHCQLCEKCINKFDHHCVWIGSCVGELNHRKFWIFLFLQTAVQIWTYIIVNSGIDAIYSHHASNEHNNDHSDSENKSIDLLPYETTEYILFMVIAFILFLATLFTGVLLVFHTYLIFTNQTTWEFTRKDTLNYLRIYPKTFHPFSKGAWENIKMVFFHHNKVRIWNLPSPPPSQ